MSDISNNSKEIFAERLEYAMKRAGITAAELAKKTGLSPSLISQYLSKKFTAKNDKAYILAEALNVSPTWLMGLDDKRDRVTVVLPSPERIRTIPVYSRISCGTGLFVDDEIVDTITIPVSMLPNRSAEYFAQYAAGDSMTGAGIFPGDLVIFRKTNIIDNGQIGCFCIDTNEATCKKFSRIGGTIFLLPANDKYSPIPIEPENECFRIVGVKALLISKEKNR